MTRQEQLHTAIAMGRFAGSFFAALAEALYKADANNAQRLLDAFPEIATRYGPGTHLYAQAQAEAAP